MSLTRLLALVLLLAPTSAPAQGPPPALDKAGDPLPQGAGIRLGTTRFRHPGSVVIVGYSGDGSILITHSDDANVYFWDARTGREVHKLEVKAKSQRFSMRGTPSVMISGDGGTLALGVEDGQCTMVEVATRKTLREFKLDRTGTFSYGPDEGSRDYLSHDGRVLVTVDGDRWGGESKLSTWDTAAGKLIQQHQPKEKGNMFQAACVSRDGKTLVVAEGPSERGGKGAGASKVQIRFMDLASGIEQRTIACPVTTATGFALLGDGKRLIVRGRNEGVRLVDVGTGKEIHQFPGKLGTIRTVYLSADQKSLFVADGKQITQHDVDTGKDVRSFRVAGAQPQPDEDFNPFSRGFSFSLAVSPDGKTLAVPDQLAVSLWDVPSGKEAPVVAGHRHRIDSVAFGPVGQLLTSSGDGKVLLWDAATSQVLREFEQKPKSTKEGVMMNRGGIERVELFKVRATMSPDAKSVAGLWWGGKLHVWDLQTGKLRHLLGADRGYTGFSYSADGKYVSLVSRDGVIELWDPEAGRELRTFGSSPVTATEPPGPNADFERPEMGAFATAFAPDGRTVISSGMVFGERGLRTQIQYWELASGQERHRIETRMNISSMMDMGWVASALDNAVMACAFTPDGKIAAEAGFSNIRLRNLRTGDEVRSFGGKQVIARTVLFSPDGKMLIAGKYDGGLRLWDVATGTVVMDFPAHRAHVTALAFSPDGRLLMTGAGDTSVLVWDWLHISKQAVSRRVEPSLTEPEKLWADLAGQDAPMAYAAIRAFASTPAQTVAFLKTHLRPTAPVDAKVLAKLIEDLDHPGYETRQKAQKTLDKLGDLAADAIKDRLARPASAEMSARLGELQKKLDQHTATPEILQAQRAVEILESIDGVDARAVLDALAQGVPGHRVTQEARSSLKRLNRK